ncbi:unnamed protein product [Schistocephalus solidus]|uniref:C2H2-type domain-containing protein n=1 Tax=Schistocephalus solidus TaxID=70667 RepID=A0A183SSV9_SCHSO|nr:unnamed protein product [Schistocephalus solidus]
MDDDPRPNDSSMEISLRFLVDRDTLKQLQINPANWEDLARNRPTWRTVKRGAAIYEAQVRWSGHLVRMDDGRLPKRIFYRDVATAPILPPIIITTTSQYSSPVTSTTITTISDGDSLVTCAHCDRTFPSRIGLVGHLRINRTENGEPVPGSPTNSRDHRLHCPHAFTDRMGLFGHMHIHGSGIQHNADNANTPRTPSAPANLTTTTMNDIPPAFND